MVRKELSQMKNSYDSLNALSRANSLFMKSVARSFMLCYMENRSRIFTNILIFFLDIMVPIHSLCDHDLRKEIKIFIKIWVLFSIRLFNTVKLLAILQIKASKTIIKEFYITR